MPLYLGETHIEGLRVGSDQGGGSAVVEQLNVNASGTFTPGTGVDGYNPVVVPAGTEGTPSATKGTVNNHAIQVTPKVTNTGGYIAGGVEKTGTPVSVQASELVSGTKSITTSGETDVTNYQKASVAAGSEGTPTASKGTVSNNSVAVTPSVTNTAGLISGGTKSGTPVTVSASELVSGKKEITSNGDDIDVTNFQKVKVAVPGASGKNVQYVMGSKSVRTNGYTSTGMTITVAKAGTYNVSWVGWRSSSQGTMGTNLYKNGSAGTNQQTFTNTYGQCITLENQSYAQGDVLTLYATAGSTSRYMWVANLIIEEQ